MRCLAPGVLQHASARVCGIKSGRPGGGCLPHVIGLCEVKGVGEVGRAV
jgi:hypothetical protein